MGWVVNATPRPLYPLGKDLVLIVYEAGWAPGQVWTDVEKLASPGFDPLTVKPVASHYTDHAIPAHMCVYRTMQIVFRNTLF
jgi:hypothetical protein